MLAFWCFVFPVNFPVTPSLFFN